MPEFNKNVVLEKILTESPILTNLRGETIGAKGQKVIIYAYYFNRGEPDSELKYDMLKNPVKTTSQSTLCEIYSGLKRKKGEYSGPWLDESFDGLDPSRDVRSGAAYRFLDTSAFFAEHFNKLCRSLGYEPRLSGNCVMIKMPAIITLGGLEIFGKVVADRNIGIDLESHDPSISKVLGLIDKAYKSAREHYKEDESFVFERADKKS